MSFHFVDIARNAAADHVVTDAEILDLRRAGWADGKMTREEAEAIFALQRAISEPTASWSDFFVEAMRNYVLEGTEPRGYACEAEAAWLIEQVMMDGAVCSMDELELLVSVIETARNVPEELKTFVLGTIQREVLHGTGPTRCGGELSDRHVSKAEAAILRRVLFGQASDRPGAISRREAEMLFRLKDMTLHQANHPEFRRLFVQGVGNYLMGFSADAAQISRERALELEAFVADNRVRVGRFMGQMAKSAPGVLGVVFGRKQPQEPSRWEQIAAEHAITPREQDWLDAQIAANGETDEYEEALIAWIRDESVAA